jgi:hypothetical protein
MPDMTVGEAVDNLEGMMVWFEDADVDSVPFNKTDALDLRIVLDELKALHTELHGGWE